MSGEKVEDIEKGKLDFTGAAIETVYSKVSNTYAVYGTNERVMVQYADAGLSSDNGQALGKEQRLALAPLNPIRGEINGLIDGWRTGGRVNAAKQRSRAKRFDRATADALTVALQGDQVHAAELLVAVRNDILEERTSIGRTEYLIVASLFAALVALIGWLILSPLSTPPALAAGAADTSIQFKNLWIATSVGALGALFSIALVIRSREIKPDLQRRDNWIDAILRILIGAVSASIFFSLLNGKLLTFGFGDTEIDLAMNLDQAVVLAFLAGFSERLVGDVLTKAAASAQTGASGAAAVKEAQAASDVSRGANESNPRGNDRSADSAEPGRGSDDPDRQAHEEGHIDGCLCDSDVQPDEVTSDVELPEASGGVESGTRANG